MAVIKVQKVTSSIKEPSVEDVLARFCYHYPQYTLRQAKDLPLKRIIQMLKVVRQEQAKEWYNLARAIGAPHAKDKGTLNKLLNEFKEIIQS